MKLEMFKKDKQLSILPKATLQRFLLYQRILAEENTEIISSEEIGKKLHLPSELIRKDLSYLQYRGRPKIGYRVKLLLDELNEIFGLSQKMKVILVGAGHLGVSLVNYPGFKNYRVEIVALFDHDPSKVDTLVGPLVILPLEDMKRVISRFKVTVGIICVPKESAQAVAELMIQNGIEAIWNFAPTTLNLPKSIIVKNEDVTGGILILKHMINKGKK